MDLELRWFRNNGASSSELHPWTRSPNNNATGCQQIVHLDKLKSFYNHKILEQQ